MIEAKLLHNFSKDGQTPHGNKVRIDHIQTRHGITAVRSVIPPDATQEIFVAGGLLSGANYDRLVNRASDRGFIIRTVRHGSNSMWGAIDADADEFAASIEQTAEHPVHVMAHSKGARVAVKAVARLDQSIQLKRVLFTNPAFEKSHIPSPSVVLGAAWEQIACMGKLKHAAQGVFHEVTRRGLGVVGEVFELFKADETLDADLQTIHDRGVHLGLFDGSFDHIVPTANTAVTLRHMHFDRVDRMEGKVQGSHFGILASDQAVDLILSHAS